MILSLQPGSEVYFKNEKYIIRHLIDFVNVSINNIETGEMKIVKLSEISSYPNEEPTPIFNTVNDLSELTQEQIEQSEYRYLAIEPLLSPDRQGRKAVDIRSVETDISTNTLYRWLRRFKNSGGALSSLLDREGRGGKGKSRLSQEIQEIMQHVIEEHYLTKMKPTMKKTYEELLLICDDLDIIPPTYATLRRHIQKINPRKAAYKREGSHKAHEYIPLQYGGYPDYISPLHTIQIDHTPVDIMLVDDVSRLPLGRPHITLAIDVYSRMITGYYISFESPGYLSTSMAIASSVLPKTDILNKYKIDAIWPVMGLPQFVHADNAQEFRGMDLQRVCQEYDINIQWRPVARPHFGGHIERLIRTLNEDIHNLEGTTFSNIKQRDRYDPEKQANMTLSEFEKWLLVLIAKKYHNSKHEGLNGKTPLKKYEEGIFGTDTTPPLGHPRLIEDRIRFLVNLLPSEKRTIQRYGIQIDGIDYYHPILEDFIGLKEGRSKMKFQIRRDPRDISIVYFLNPEDKQFYEIPYRNPSFPRTSLWEWRAVKSELRLRAERDYQSYEVFQAMREMREIALRSIEKSKIARKKVKRNISLLEGEGYGRQNNAIEDASTSFADKFPDEDIFSDIEPFDVED